MACHICIKTGIRECDSEFAEIKCDICGVCAAELKRADQKLEVKHLA